MEIFRRGSDPPLIFGSYGICEAKFNFGHKKGKKLNHGPTNLGAVVKSHLISPVSKPNSPLN